MNQNRDRRRKDVSLIEAHSSDEQENICLFVSVYAHLSVCACMHVCVWKCLFLYFVCLVV